MHGLVSQVGVLQHKGNPVGIVEGNVGGIVAGGHDGDVLHQIG